MSLHFYLYPSLKRPRTLAAFTLVELLTVIGIVGILAAILIPALGSVRTQAKKATAISNVRQLGMMNLMFSQDQKGRINGQGDFKIPQAKKPNFMARVAYYYQANQTSIEGLVAWEDIVAALSNMRDPSVPDELLGEPGTIQWTWAVNKTFSVWKHDGDLPYMINYDASNIIYAVAGKYIFDAEQVWSDVFLTMPTDGPRNGPYFTYGDQTPAVFLDGSVRMETFPIDPKKVDPDYVTN